MYSTKLIRSLKSELEKAGLLRSDKTSLVKHLKNLEHAFSVRDPKRVAKAIDQIAKDLMD